MGVLALNGLGGRLLQWPKSANCFFLSPPLISDLATTSSFIDTALILTKCFIRNKIIPPIRLRHRDSVGSDGETTRAGAACRGMCGKFYQPLLWTLDGISRPLCWKPTSAAAAARVEEQ